jgi:hypothetical protein
VTYDLNTEHIRYEADRFDIALPSQTIRLCDALDAARQFGIIASRTAGVEAERAVKAEAERDEHKAERYRLMKLISVRETEWDALRAACRDRNRGCCVDGTCCSCCDRADKAEAKLDAVRALADAWYPPGEDFRSTANKFHAWQIRAILDGPTQ